MRVRRLLGWTALAIPLVLFAVVFVAYWMSDNVCSAPAAAPNTPVKAIVFCEYGSADVLALEDIEKPAPENDEILVRVHAAAANAMDWHIVRGTPYVIRLTTGLRVPGNIRLGVDFAGTVEAVGRNVTRLRPGDEVFGNHFGGGAFGEYVTVPEDGAIVPKPASVTFEQAASAPLAALTALQALRDAGGVQAGDRVLINGASGGIGTFADGTTVLVGDADIGNWIGPLIRPINGLVYSPFVSQEFVPFLTGLNQADLRFVGELMQSGEVTPVIDRRYSLSEVPDAIRYMEKGHARGKVVITVPQDRSS